MSRSYRALKEGTDIRFALFHYNASKPSFPRKFQFSLISFRYGTIGLDISIAVSRVCVQSLTVGCKTIKSYFRNVIAYLNANLSEVKKYLLVYFVRKRSLDCRALLSDFKLHIKGSTYSHRQGNRPVFDDFAHEVMFCMIYN